MLNGRNVSGAVSEPVARSMLVNDQEKGAYRVVLCGV